MLDWPSFAMSPIPAFGVEVRDDGVQVLENIATESKRLAPWTLSAMLRRRQVGLHEIP